MSKRPAERPPALSGRLAGSEKCLGCRLCQVSCPVGAVRFLEGRPEKGPGCLCCAACLEVCPAGFFALRNPYLI